jgi:phosphopantothenoylcysteine decarboxylase/phosphopantothenate--cysteine ligase
MRPVLLTAGATRNRVDAIRYLSAHATGRTGVDLAARLARAGRPVHMLGSAEACLRAEVALLRTPLPRPFTHAAFEGTRDLMARMEAHLRAAPDSVLLHSAAVGDYEMAASETGKIPSGRERLTLELVPAPKIVDHVRTWAPGCFLVSFKAAAPGTTLPELERIARAQALRTRSNLVFANVLGDIAHDVLLVDADRTRHFPTRDAALDALLAALPG